MVIEKIWKRVTLPLHIIPAARTRTATAQIGILEEVFE
jgi:hypothetical protein